MKKNTLSILSLLFSFCIIVSCQKELSFEQTAFTVAQGSLWDTAGNCLPDSVHGTYYNGVRPGSDTAYVEVQVDVKVAGTYNISTDVQNGFMFKDSGIFAATGINIIKLKPVGIPVAIQSTTFAFSFDSSTCGFVVNVQDSTGTGLGGTDTTTVPPTDSVNLSDTAWQFNVDTFNYYHGQVDTAFIKDSLTGEYLAIVGRDAGTGDTTFALGIFALSGSIGVGTYTTGTYAGVYLSAFDTSDQPVTIYRADLSTFTSGTTTIRIESYDAVTGIMTGTFDGAAVDKNGIPVVITNGRFKVRVT